MVSWSRGATARFSPGFSGGLVCLALVMGLSSASLGGCAPKAASTTLPSDSIGATWDGPLAPTVTEPAPPDDKEPSEASVAVIGGLSGASWALAHGRPRTALDALKTVDLREEGSPAWFRAGAIAGRAHLALGEPAEAVDALASRVEHNKLRHHFPTDVLVHELARAEMALATSGTLETAQADALLEKAAARLARIQDDDHIRNLPVLRVDWARALAEIDGGKKRFWAAKTAQRALERVIRDYPDYPHVGDLRLLKARALERQSKTRDAAAELRSIHIQRAGEPESRRAWLELERLAAEDRRVRVVPLSPAESLQMAQWGRVLRRVDTSRAILDDLLADDRLPRSLREQAQRSRAYTAYTQRDFAACAADLWEVLERTSSVTGELLRCLERGHQYDEAIGLVLKKAKRGNRYARASALWSAIHLSIRGGQYGRAESLLEQYAKLSKGHARDRRWLEAWIHYRLGRIPQAIAGFQAVERYSSRSEAERARYFRGKLLLRSDAEEDRKQGEELLRALATDEPFAYYGIQARQRLWDANIEPGPLPTLEPVPDEANPPSWEESEALLASLVDQFGGAWPSLLRAAQLQGAGYIEEARRELRITNEAFLTAGRRTRSPRSESLIQGIGWRSEWTYPRVGPTREGRRDLRSDGRREALRKGLRRLALALDEPHHWAELTPTRAYPYKSRWHPRAFREALEREATVQGLDPVHLWALMYTESRFRRHVVSPVGARGALQIMPWTGRQLAQLLGDIEVGDRFDVDQLFDIDYNARLSAYYVAELMKKFHGQAAMVYASYNGGPNSVARWLVAKSGTPEPLEIDTFIEEIPFSQTERYTKRVLEVTAAYSAMYQGAIPQWNNTIDPVVENNIDF